MGRSNGIAVVPLLPLFRYCRCCSVIAVVVPLLTLLQLFLYLQVSLFRFSVIQLLPLLQLSVIDGTIALPPPGFRVCVGGALGAVLRTY